MALTSTRKCPGLKWPCHANIRKDVDTNMTWVFIIVGQKDRKIAEVSSTAKGKYFSRKYTSSKNTKVQFSSSNVKVITDRSGI